MADGRTSPAGARGSRDERPDRPVVLLVDDEVGIREVVRAMLQLAGYRVLVAGSGEEALQAAAAHEGPIDLLLTDVVMPGIQGPELGERLRAIRPHTRVLLMSGVSDDLRGGLAKPFSCGALLRAISATLTAPR
jgi:two-component system cell cycle sensor histidine kinase/response regulator CckA